MINDNQGYLQEFICVVGVQGKKTLACHNNKENDDNHWFTLYDM